MERGHIEIIAKMYDIAQGLVGREGGGPGTADCGAQLSRIRALAAKAPASLKAARPSFGWDELSRMGLQGAEDARLVLDEYIPQMMAAALSEFGLERGTLVYHAPTAHSYAVVFDSEIDGCEVRLLFLDGVLSSAEYRDGSPALLYPPLLVRSFALLNSPSRGLVLGVAGGTMMEVLKRAFHTIHVDGVDIDAEVLGIGRRFFSLKDDSRTSIVVGDAREYIRNCGKKYDVIIMDAFAGISPVPHLATIEFAREARERMNPGGVCAINIIAKVERAGYLQYSYDTWRSVFRNVFALPLCKEGDVFNVVLIATDSDSRDFEARNRDAIYPMEFDPGKVFTDRDNRIRELSPY